MSLLLRRSCLAFDVIGDAKIPRIERQIVRNGDGLDARRGGDTFEEGVIELLHLLRRVTVVLQIHFSGHPVFDLETQFDVLRVEQAAKTERAGDQQDKTDRDLSDDERAGKTRAPDTASLRIVLQGRGKIAPRSLP